MISVVFDVFVIDVDVLFQLLKFLVKYKEKSLHFLVYSMIVVDVVGCYKLVFNWTKDMEG